MPILSPINPTHPLNRFLEDQFFLYYADIYVEVFQVVTYHFKHLSLTECNSGITPKLPIWSWYYDWVSVTTASDSNDILRGVLQLTGVPLLSSVVVMFCSSIVVLMPNGQFLGLYHYYIQWAICSSPPPLSLSLSRTVSSSWFDHSNSCWGVQSRRCRSCSVLNFSDTSSSKGPNAFLSTLYSLTQPRNFHRKDF